MGRPRAVAAPRSSRRAAAWLLALAAAAAPALGAEPVFVERAAEAGLDFVHFNGMTGRLFYSEMVGSGVALVDYDLDGDLDVFLVQGEMLEPDRPIADALFAPRHPLPLEDRLYRNDTAPGPDGRPVPRFVDVTERSETRSTGYGMGVAVGDVDNDGDPDLYVTNAGPNRMLSNDGDGTFTDVTAASGTGDREWGVSAAFLDADGDGWLDLFVGNYVDYRVANDKACFSSTGARDYCGPLAYPPRADRFYRNRGDGTFEEFTRRSKVADEQGGALGVVTGDFNLDGWTDVYVANDMSPNKLWINQRDGTFLNEAVLAGSAVNEMGQPEASMGVVAGDFDADGDDDLFMSHLSRETNTVYYNDGTGLFQDSTRDSGLGTPSWAYTGFGVGLLDYDLDGRLDLFIANGTVNRQEELARAGDPYPLDQPNQLFRNVGGGRFVEVPAAEEPVLELSEVSRGVAAGDLDLDGDPDLVVTNNAGPVRLLVNQRGAGREWLGVRALLATGGAALGARVALLGGGATQWRRVASDGSYASAPDFQALFAYAGSPPPERLRIVWPNGRIQEFLDPAVERSWIVRQPPAGR